MRGPGVAVWVVAVATVSVVVGFAVGTGRGALAAALLAVAVAIALGLRSWRWSLYALLLYIPVAGVPIILSYPNTGPAVLLKDILFLVPAYLGFVAWAWAKRSRVLFAGAPVVLLALFALLVLGQALNPSVPNMLVGAIGVKVWLLYVPLLFLGYHLVRDRADLSRLLALMSLSAVLPLALGIVEAILINRGYAGIVYGWYGDSAAASTQNFAQFNYGPAGVLRRVPSTFSFVTQYYAFTVSMVVVTYAWWQGVLVGTKWAWLGRLIWLLAIAAAFLSGARSAFLVIPFLVLLIVALDRRAGLRLSGRLLIPVAALFATVAALGATVPTLMLSTLQTAALSFNAIFVEGFRQALGTTWLGLGTGINTNAARYAYSRPELFQGVGGTWYESWWVKIVLELGVVGLLLVGLLFATLVGKGLREHRALGDPRLRVISAALLAFLIWNLAFGVKGQYIDFDPINVYFWLFAGVLAKIAVLDRNRDGDAETKPSDITTIKSPPRRLGAESRKKAESD